jgi:mono/diheme cytochrome c family protein
MKMFTIMLAVALVLGINAAASAQGKGTADQTAGARIFNANCSRCHPNGGNVIVPNLPLAGSSKLHSFKTFLGWIRNPLMPDGSEGAMPAFSRKRISDQQARTLYHYIISMQTAGPQSEGYGPGYGMGGYGGGYGMGPGRMGGYGGGYGRGMMGGYGGGYGMGPGRMGGYGSGYGPGMMGGYGGGGGYGPGAMGGYGAGPGNGYGSPECRKFLDATAGLRKELSNKRFEYSEAYRNPKANQETILRLEGEISDLQDKIAEKAPLGCGW